MKEEVVSVIFSEGNVKKTRASCCAIMAVTKSKTWGYSGLSVKDWQHVAAIVLAAIGLICGIVGLAENAKTLSDESDLNMALDNVQSLLASQTQSLLNNDRVQEILGSIGVRRLLPVFTVQSKVLHFSKDLKQESEKPV